MLINSRDLRTGAPGDLADHRLLVTFSILLYFSPPLASLPPSLTQTLFTRLKCDADSFCKQSSLTGPCNSRMLAILVWTLVVADVTADGQGGLNMFWQDGPLKEEGEEEEWEGKGEKEEVHCSCLCSRLTSTILLEIYRDAPTLHTRMQSEFTELTCRLHIMATPDLHHITLHHALRFTTAVFKWLLNGPKCITAEL